MNSEHEAERAGFDTLAKDQMDGIARHRASVLRDRLVQENAHDLHRTLASVTLLLSAIMADNAAADQMPKVYAETLADALALLKKVQGVTP